MLETLRPESGRYDSVVRQCFKGNKNTCVSWFLTLSYAYYQLDESLVSDTVFDGLCKWMLENYDSLKHEHKSLVTKEMLSAGSAFNLKDVDYPLRVRHSAPVLIKQMYSGTGSAAG